MTKVELIAMAERWQTKADRAMERYQEDGLPRHNREREQAQADAAGMTYGQYVAAKKGGNAP